MATITALSPLWMLVNGKTNYYYAGDSFTVSNEYAETLAAQYQGRITVRMTRESFSPTSPTPKVEEVKEQEEPKPLESAQEQTTSAEVVKEEPEEYPLPKNATAKSILELLEDVETTEPLDIDFVKLTKERYPDYKTVQRKCDELLE